MAELAERDDGTPNSNNLDNEINTEMSRLSQEQETRNIKEPANPFSAEVAPGGSFLVLMRVYDVLMSIYAELNQEDCEKLAALHDKGGLMLDFPHLSEEATRGTTG